MNENPRLRYIEVFPHEQGGKHLFVLRDPAQISPNVLFVPRELLSVLALLNGQNSVLDIQAELTRIEGQLVYREQIEGIIQKLDEAFFLENDNFRSFRRKQAEAYSSEVTRSSAQAGIGYPRDPAPLHEMIDSFYMSPEGAGIPEGHKEETAPRAVVAPHIDLRLGGPVYTHAYRVLAERPPADLYIVLGTGHMGLSTFFSVSKKNFDTPFGIVEADQGFIRLFEQEAGEGTFPEDLSHRTEHSIEFQMVFLKHLYPNRSIKIFPALCSFSFLDFEDGGTGFRELFERFVRSLRNAIDDSENEKKICVIASVDLAHVGTRYGDLRSPDSFALEDIQSKDQRMLQLITEGNAAGFLEFIRGEQDNRRICGFPAIYTLLETLPDLKGNLHSYSHCRIDDSGSLVTYAALSFS